MNHFQLLTQHSKDIVRCRKEDRLSSSPSVKYTIQRDSWGDSQHRDIEPAHTFNRREPFYEGHLHDCVTIQVPQFLFKQIQLVSTGGTI